MNALVSLVSFGVSGIYLSFLLTVIAAIVARAAAGCPREASQLGQWAWPVPIIAAVYLGLMLLNVVYPSGLASPRGYFNIDWITLLVMFVIAVVGADRLRDRPADPTGSSSTSTTPSSRRRRRAMEVRPSRIDRLSLPPRAHTLSHAQLPRLRDGARRRGGQAPGAAHGRPRQARRPLRGQLPADRLRALEPRQRRPAQDRRAHAVQEPEPRPSHRDDVAPVAAARQLRHAGAGADASRARAGSPARPTRSTRTSTSSTTSAPTTSASSVPTTSTAWTRGR